MSTTTAMNSPFNVSQAPIWGHLVASHCSNRIASDGPGVEIPEEDRITPRDVRIEEMWVVRAGGA